MFVGLQIHTRSTCHRRRHHLPNQAPAVDGFIPVSCAVALLFIAGWGIYWGQWPIPQFSESGLL